ncbi:site-specific integrase [Rhizobium leguminosarum]|uniref:site-specific integrase n=1 Tax=Rhizobium TaxID=379 RepID=UPI00140FF361|nr:site-specific integrase [Rhizobium leguminosarum]QIO66060.1 integrase [Rhizobium leguminosarum bv. trifolii]
MARVTYLERRGATYYARLDVPLDLVSHYGTTTRKKSLRTKDENEAKKRLWPVVEGWRTEFEEIRARREITADDSGLAVWRHYEATIERYDQKQRSMPTRAQTDAELQSLYGLIDQGKITGDNPYGMINAYVDYELMLRARDDDANLRSRRLTALKSAIGSGDIQLIEPAVESFIKQNNLLVQPGSDQYRHLCVSMARAEIEGLQRTLERDKGDFTGAPKDPIVKPVSRAVHEAAAPGETIMELFEIYARENPNRIKQDTLGQARRDVGLFVEHVGSTFPAHRIDKKAAREWKALLMQYPVKATETKAFQGMTIRQIIEHNKTIKKPAISSTTVNRYLSGFSAFCTWMTNHGYLTQNPASDMFLKKAKKSTTRPFTVVEMNTLFASPFFTGCVGDEAPRFWSKPGDVLIRDYRYWVPLVMAFSGARPGEIAQLAVSDVREQQGHWVMHITDEGEELDGKSVKNEKSARLVPLHRELVSLGFLDYHAQMLGSGQKRLFPEAVRNSRGQMIATFSRDFPRYLAKIDLKDGRGLSLYSFRHGVFDAFRRAGYLDEQYNFLLGHASGNKVTGGYGILPQGILEKRVGLVNSISYPGLMLDHLKLAK